jgi:hypothetical protein
LKIDNQGRHGKSQILLQNPFVGILYPEKGGRRDTYIFAARKIDQTAFSAQNVKNEDIFDERCEGTWESCVKRAVKMTKKGGGSTYRPPQNLCARAKVDFQKVKKGAKNGGQG